jgi:hypothetical protein
VLPVWRAFPPREERLLKRPKASLGCPAARRTFLVAMMPGRKALANKKLNVIYLLTVERGGD